MTIESTSVWILLALAIAVAVTRGSGRLAALNVAQPVGVQGNWGERFYGLFEAVGLHKKLFRKPLAGIIHALVFFSFFVLITPAVQVLAYGLVPWLPLRQGSVADTLGVLQDVFAALMLIGIALAIYNRLVIRPKRFDGSNKLDAGVVLGFISAIVILMELQFAFEFAAGEPTALHPAAALLAKPIIALGFGAQALTIDAKLFYVAHVATILGFLAYIPGSKHLHMFTGVFAVLFRTLGAKGTLSSPPILRAGEPVKTIANFTKKDVLDVLSCTECGRCQDVCPAHAAGMRLSPKVLMMDLRDALAARPHPIRSEKILAGGVIAAETLWACTSCYACVDACPVQIEQLPKIVGMRRALVDVGDVSTTLQAAMTALQKNGNSFRKPRKSRPKWTTGLSFEIKDARVEPVDVLWFVGDFASFDPRVQAFTRGVAELFHRAGLDFGIIFESEQNSGNDIRRAGDEGLFRTLAESNIAALAECTFNRIVTTDPHTFNALRNDYPEFGGHYDVCHYAEVIEHLIASGSLTLSQPSLQGKATYHDPCYLGRYNDCFEAPRRVIASTGLGLRDMPRCRENSFCCGAGGGRIWQADAGTGERASESRIREAMALDDVKYFVVACPKDVVMYASAVESLGVGDRIAVKELAELVTMMIGPQRTPTTLERLS
ncbi:MAG: (Fe-S)-binding protein [Beijerinckiaceae bacterium]